MNPCLISEVYMDKAICNNAWDNYFQAYSIMYLGQKENDWMFVKAIAWCESRYQENAVSPAGAIGVMQVMPTTGLMLGFSYYDLFNAKLNIKCACEHLANLMTLFGNDRKKVVCAYNCGGRRVQWMIKEYGVNWFDHLPGETKDYYLDVAKVYNNLSKCLV